MISQTCLILPCAAGAGELATAEAAGTTSIEAASAPAQAVQRQALWDFSRMSDCLTVPAHTTANRTLPAGEHVAPEGVTHRPVTRSSPTRRRAVYGCPTAAPAAPGCGRRPA